MSGPTYDPKGSSFPKPIPFGRAQPLERREEVLMAICRVGECLLPIRGKDEIGAPSSIPCAGRCRLKADPDRADPILPKPPRV